MLVEEDFLELWHFTIEEMQLLTSKLSFMALQIKFHRWRYYTSVNEMIIISSTPNSKLNLIIPP